MLVALIIKIKHMPYFLTTKRRDAAVAYQPFSLFIFSTTIYPIPTASSLAVHLIFPTSIMNHSQTNHVQINRTTPSSELSKVMTHPESFRLLYFPVEAQGQTSRDLLVYGGANWESATPQVYKFLNLCFVFQNSF